jgi:hypothetical protein
MMAPGLTLWFESDNGQKMGIHYPMGFAGQEPRSNYGGGNGEPQQRGQMAQKSLGELEILGPGKYDRNILSTNERGDIKVKISTTGNLSVYELRLPLHESVEHPYAAGVSPGSTLRVEIESGKFEAHRPEGMSEGEGARSGGGRRGGHGGGYPGGGTHGGGGRGGAGSSGGNRPEPIDANVKVRLASAGNGV